MKWRRIYTGFFILIIISGVGAYYLSQQPSTPPPTIQEKPPQVIGHSAYLDKIDERIIFYTVVGVVQNNLRTNIEAVNVTASFYDAADYLIGSRYSPIVVEILKPEQRSPFAIYMKVDPTTSFEDISYELSVEYHRTSVEPITGLVIANQTSSIDQNGYHIVSGAIQNRGLRKAYSVSLYCMYYDENHNFLTISRTFVVATMEIGQIASFHLNSSPNKITPARYELLIVPQAYGLLFVSNITLFFALGVVFVLFIVYMRRRGW
ncbi:MAG: FxLYD domain-containing protein [Candidatus Heimdallarchaeota archaeon]